MKPVRLAVLDIAGTTVRDDDAVARAFRNAFIKNGYGISLEDAHPYMGVKKIDAVKEMLTNLQVSFTEDTAAAIHEDFVKEMMEYYRHDPAVKPFTDTEQVFSKMKEAGIRIALNTGFPRIIAAAIIHRFQWMERGLIDDYIASDEVSKGRPSAEMIQVLMQRAGISDASEVLKAGDTTVDIQEGHQAGCGYIIALTTGAGQEEELLAEEPTHLLPSLSAITTLLGL